MIEDGERKISKIYWSINTQSGKSSVELLWAGATNVYSFVVWSGFWDLRADGNEITNNVY